MELSPPHSSSPHAGSSANSRTPTRRRDDRSVQIEWDKWMKLSSKIVNPISNELLMNTKEELKMDTLNNLQDLMKGLDATDWMFNK